ncbi:MAG: tRNA (adenosine(37)-N6)-dimethylallyltransferase MiaA [Bacteroidota bacterium]
MKKLIVVVGPTAVGKTVLCVRLAKWFSTEIISADSRQFYKEMSIGTAKPTPEEMQAIPHHFVDSHTIHEEYSVGHFEKEALVTLQNIYQKKEVAILTGGSGLYTKVICDGIDDMPEADLALRQQLNQRLEKEGLAQLLKELKMYDLAYYKEVDRANPQRVIRALEVYLSTGKPFSSFRKQEKVDRPFECIKIGLNRTREELYERINHRMDLMLQNGLLEEVKALYAYRQHNALKTVGYKEIFDYLEGQYDWEECVRLLKRNSRHYAKRQLTWFKKDEAITWFHPEAYEEIVDFIQKCL